VDDKGHEAQAMVGAVETGQSDNLVGAMLKSQEASLNFQMMMQVRNKVVSGLDDLIKLPI
jgi:flagellar hook-basal body complex protein FliE